MKIRAMIACVALQFCFSGACKIDESYEGGWYSMEAGRDKYTLVDQDKWGEFSCEQKHIHERPKAEVGVRKGVNSTMLMKKSDNCYACLDVLWRTDNILQYRQSGCFSNNSGFETLCKGINELPSQNEVITLFRQTLKTVDCIDTWEGVYQFTYEVAYGGGGICNHPDNRIAACQDPGSAVVDNQLFLMTYARCPGVQTSRSETIRYQCMGSWYALIDGESYTFAAIADTVEKDSREKYKCLITKRDQKTEDNSIHWGMSRFADCSRLNSIYNSPVRLQLIRVPPQTPYVAPQCSLSRRAIPPKDALYLDNVKRTKNTDKICHDAFVDCARPGRNVAKFLFGLKDFWQSVPQVCDQPYSSIDQCLRLKTNYPNCSLVNDIQNEAPTLDNIRGYVCSDTGKAHMAAMVSGSQCIFDLKKGRGLKFALQDCRAEFQWQVTTVMSDGDPETELCPLVEQLGNCIIGESRGRCGAAHQTFVSTLTEHVVNGGSLMAGLSCPKKSAA